MDKNNHNIHITGNVVQSVIINGDHNSVFIKEYESLRHSFISPVSFFESLNLGRFQGREWLFAAVDDFLNQHDRGLFVLRAVAGASKSAFLAHLIKQRYYIHHFVSLAPGEGGITSGMLNLAVQLIRQWQLETYATQGFLPRSAIRPDFLQTIIAQAALKRDQTNPEEKIVIVIDALDEAGTPYGHNVLGLPTTLPRGAYFIVSQRPVPIVLSMDVPRKIMNLDVTGEENLFDIREYISGLLQRPEISNLVQQSRLPVSQVSKLLYEKSLGLWIYLHSLEIQIESGHIPSLMELPDGIVQYYARYWLAWRNRDREQWQNVFLPMLATLTAAREAIPMSILQTWSGIDLPVSTLIEIIEGTWRPFIVSERRKNGNYYRLYHSTLREFFSGQADPKLLGDSEQLLLNETSDAVKLANAKIADYYFKSWGGRGSTLDGLKDASRRTQDNGYGLRYVPAHLIDADMLEEFHQLLQLSRECHSEISVPRTGKLGNLFSRRDDLRPYSYKENIWYVAHKESNDVLGYLNDIDTAWRLAERIYSTNKDPRCISRQIQYALIRASINSQLSNTTPELLPWLIRNHVWDYEQARIYIKTIRDPEKKGVALLAIADQLADEDKPLFLNTVRDLAKEVPADSEYKTARFISLLTRMLKHLVQFGYSREAHEIVATTDLILQVQL